MRVRLLFVPVVLFGGLACADIALVSHGRPDVVSPRVLSDGGTGAYGLGSLYQVGPTTAALFANVRTIGVGHHDFEDGTDAFLFDSLPELARRAPIVLSRNEWEQEADGKFPVAHSGPVLFSHLYPR